MADELALRPEQLYRRTDPGTLGFATTAELPPLVGAIGQAEGMAALEFGVTMRGGGYNIFVLGESGSGRRSFVLEALHRRAGQQAPPPDWCYVQSFTDSRRPRAVAVAAGRGDALARDVALAIEDLRRLVPPALEADEAVGRRTAAAEARERQAGELLDEFRAELKDNGSVVLRETENDYGLIPAHEGQPLKPETYLALPEEVREAIDAQVREARNRMLTINRRMHDLQREARAAVAEINRDATARTVQLQLAPLHAKYAGERRVLAHLEALAHDIEEHQEQFATTEREKQPAPLLPQEDFFKRYAVNVIVRNAPAGGAPVIEERHPTYAALVGHVARQMQFGAVVTDFTGITAGGLHRANGGYLVLDAEDLLTRPLAWSALKRVLRTREVKPVEPSGEMGLVVTDMLDPEPIPAALKVILVGEPGTFYLLRAADDEFRELFKVKADFRPDVERTPETERAYAAFVASAAPREGAPPFDAAAVACIIEEGSRIAADQNKLTTRFGLIADLVRESSHWSLTQGRGQVTVADVQHALLERDTRERRPHRALLELIERRILAFAPSGEAAGQLYGIAVITVGDEAFGRPMKVMATAFVGQGGLSNLEREVAMSGPIHTKGFLLLSGYVARRFARNRPLALSATISFDQVYEEIEGDSASAAELFALLSAVSDVPIRQGIAVTGAVNQVGTILPVGGVTEKIEGFFAACQRVGLTGEQGVILPRRNLANLVLRDEVRDAVAAGRFHVWAIDAFEDGWPILTGLSAGEEDEYGEYPPGTIYRAVTDRMDSWAGMDGEEESAETPPADN
ncbi:MAG: ATP-dependent protease [Gemmatimonadetes bacterium]|nr:ATP-dependent protease [Gemmatimonadota bacterium]